MRFKHCELKAFGHFRDFEARKIDKPVVVILGPNEAGKSTFFSFLRTILYGVYPASLEGHPYAPRDGKPLEGSARIVTSDGTSLEVRRRLKNTPQGFLRDNVEIELRNHSVPFTGSVSRRVFESVYALKLHDMTAIASGAWDEVQERLLGRLSVDFLQSARKVSAELEKEGNALWRSDKRGKPATKRLREKKAALQASAREARSRYEGIREIHAQIVEAREQLAETRERRGLRLREHERLESLAPVARRWAKIQALRTEVGDLTPFVNVPLETEKTLTRWRMRESEILNELEELGDALERGERHRAAVVEADHRVFKQKSRILAWARRSVSYEHASQELDQARGESAQLSTLIDDRSRRVFDRPWDDHLSNGIRDVSGAELRRRLRTVINTDTELRSASDRAAALREKTELSGINILWLVAVVVGIAAVVAGLLLTKQIVWAIGSVVALLGAIQFSIVWLQKRKAERRVRALGLESLQSAKRDAYVSLEELCVDLPLNLTGDTPPDPEILADVQEVKSLQGKLDEQLGRVNNLQRVIEMNEQAIESLAETCGVETGQDMLETVSRLEGLLSTAEERLKAAAEAERLAPSLVAKREKLDYELGEVRSKRKVARGLLSELGEGDETSGIKILEQRRVSNDVANHLEESLNDDFPRWRQIEDEIRTITPSGMAPFSDEARVSRTGRLEDMAAEIRKKSEYIVRLEEELRSMQEFRSLDDIESEIGVVESELEENRRKRDRCFLLASIVRRADTRFRMKHQPDVVRLAESHLKQITGGRYQRLLVDDETDRLLVFERGALEPLEVGEPLSQGTRDQIYLALRFAIVDHLDRDQERLPLFLDEVFVNWDKDRRLFGLRILEDMSARRQIFVFTCHPWLAEELTDGLDAAFLTFPL